MEIATKYDPRSTENKWYKYWMEHGFFKSVPDEREPYTIVIPPPNVTGVLHMGHMLNNTIQDILIRRAKMQGKNALWVPGTDHASIATEAKVVAMLREKGIEKKNISRDEFLKYAWEWKEKHGGIILEQLKKLGASCDWDRTKFTMDEDMYESVIDVFIDLYNKGYIYRGVRMVNWDPKALTAVSDEEVIYKEVKSKLYYLRYKIEGQNDEWITIATTRPETILGDTAVCVNPQDERYKNFKGKKALLPLLDRPLPIIYDEYVDMTFGTGALKVTPAHDINDYNLGIKHKLETIDIFNDNGTLNENAKIYVGEDRFVVRKKIVKELEEKGYLVKTEELANSIGYSERTDEVIEPKLSMQWFCKMEKLSQPAIEKVMDDTISFFPSKFKNTYKHWFENIKDWCISRQLWWGHRIPAYYLPNGEFIVAKTKEEAFKKLRIENGELRITIDDLRQDEDVLDTWFSSWLWPISVFDGIRHPDNQDIKYYYPTDDLITAPEILYFWVARMIMAGYEYRNDKPFKNVYLTGIVRDFQRRKMSKSLGNSPDPIELMEKFGADGVRIGMLFSSPAGNDLLFDESYCEQGRNFSNKIWNAFRLIKGWNVDNNLEQPDFCNVSVEWFNSKLNFSIEQLNDHFTKYRISDALMCIYKLIWDDFCSWYLEMIKPAYQQPIDETTYNETIIIFEKLLKLLHPFMPFITEEIWHLIKERKEKECDIIEPIPIAGPYNSKIISQFEIAEQVVVEIRNIRKQKNIPQKESIDLLIKKNNDEKADETFDSLVKKLCNLNSIGYVEQKPDNSMTFLFKTTEFYIPMIETIDVESEIKKLKEELEYNKGFLRSVETKLHNENFVKNAPAKVLENEKKKQADAESKIKVIMEKIASLKAN
jgi:valyl-tRNA synthetase